MDISQKNLFKNEELDKELQEYVAEYGLFHPLVQTLFYSNFDDADGFNPLAAQLNEQLKSKKKRLAIADGNEDWALSLILHERYSRLQAFVDRCWMMAPEDYWSNLGWLWIDTENPSSEIDVWTMLFTNDVSNRENIMTVEERKYLESQPDSIQVFRGYDHSGKHPLEGLRWTLSQDKAEWFARRYSPDKPLLGVGEVSKDSVLAYFNGRGEQEIVVNPKDVNVTALAVLAVKEET